MDDEAGSGTSCARSRGCSLAQRRWGERAAASEPPDDSRRAEILTLRYGSKPETAQTASSPHSMPVGLRRRASDIQESADLDADEAAWALELRFPPADRYGFPLLAVRSIIAH